MQPPLANRSKKSKESDFRIPTFNRAWAIALLLVVLTVVTAVRVRLLDMPLERDEGEYAYVGQLMLQGVPPYQEAYTMKWPGTPAMYALFMGLFGETTGGIHAGLILINLATAILVFFIAKRLLGDIAGVVAAGTYALLSISPPIYGLAAHATHFVVLPAVGGILLLLNLTDRTSRARIFCAGLLLGISVLMKQPGIAFCLFAAVWLVWRELTQPGRDWSRLMLRLAYLLLGGLIPFFVMCVLLILSGTFDRFWLWTVAYAYDYVSLSTPASGVKWLLERAGALFKASPGLWSMAALGLLLLFCERSVRRSWFFVFAFALFSFLAVCPGEYFRGHYFILLLPAAGLLAGVAAQAALQWMARLRFSFHPAMSLLLIFTIAASWSLWKSRAIFFQLAPAEASRAIYQMNPFPESVEISRYLAAHCPPTARIAVLGSEPQIYFYSHRRSATGFIYMYPLTESQPRAKSMREEMIQDLENARPDYVVQINFMGSWREKANSDLSILDWFDNYQQNLQLVGWVRILPDGRTKCQWAVPDGFVIPATEKWLAIVYKNKEPFR